MPAGEWVHLEDCWIKAETDAAFKILWEGKEYWLPKSQISGWEEQKLEEGDRGVTVTISEWIANQKGIEVE